ncbi:hypothetical protein [Burkholderia vietnamiensis]|uniref:hypothetical protein n=1 Tax=Burkholderia vietnamiensis TaxID=60552 RepID=UPI00264ED3C8|nr:hypothetical protein [Burkholderia vietnamiensis]MDN7820886.1 hypothetical protein [Burkholderia vietnamiensis]
MLHQNEVLRVIEALLEAALIAVHLKGYALVPEDNEAVAEQLAFELLTTEMGYGESVRGQLRDAVRLRDSIMVDVPPGAPAECDVSALLQLALWVSHDVRQRVNESSV